MTDEPKRRDWIKREPNPLWKDSQTLHKVSDGDVLVEAARIARAMGHTLAATVLERWASEFETPEEKR